MSYGTIKKIYIATPRGFCAGVKRAIAVVDRLLEKFGPPVYVKNQIVHNKHVVANFEKKGVIFVKSLKEVPEKAILVLSAHGSSPIVNEEAKNKKVRLFDATCPLVTKVHLEAKHYEKNGYYIFYIGKKNHPEPIGILGEVSPSSITLIEHIDNIDEVTPPQNKKLVILTQTTLCVDDTKEIIERLKRKFPSVVMPPALDMCFSTQNRQNAVKQLAKKVDVILVIGSKESSNSKNLRKAAEQTGISSYLINDVNEIDISWLKGKKNLGITAGASAPEYLINNVVKYFSFPGIKIEEVGDVKEPIQFSFPKI